MIEGFQEWRGGRAKILAIVLHGWGGSPAGHPGIRSWIAGYAGSHAGKTGFTAKILGYLRRRWENRATGMRDVTTATRDALAEHGGVDIYMPTLLYTKWWRPVRASNVLVELLTCIDSIVEHRPDYERIIIIGHSLGAVLARRLFLVAAGTPPGFRSEKIFVQEARPWAARIDRMVTLGAFNRGWQVSGRMGWAYSFFLNFFGLVGHLSPRDWRPAIFDIRQGSPFIVQSRLHWLAYRRFHQDLRAGLGTPEQHALPCARAQDPVVVQLIGTKDNLASPFDQVDIAVDLPDPKVPPADQRYFFLELKGTDHDNAKVFSDTPEGRQRRESFVAALTQPPADLKNIASDPSLLAEEIADVDSDVTDTVFVMHGIRDDGFWTHRIAKQIREAGGHPLKFNARTPTYGYFAMLPFLLPWIRRQKVEWLMDQYVTVMAQFPKTRISYVGHSNGTYLAARALTDYDAITFKHVFFAGSVVERKYDWLTVVANQRVIKFHNIRAAGDKVVALLPKSLERSKKFDLGGAGFDGFDDAGKHENITQCQKYARGGHSAGIAEAQWPQIARFIVEGKAPADEPPEDFVDAPKQWLVKLANRPVVLPVLAVVFGIVIPLAFIWPLFQTLTGLNLWPHGLTTAQAVGVAFGFVAYALLVKFVVTRV